MQDTTFVRKAFYVEPPRNASVEEWQEWLKKDTRKATAAKAKHSRLANKSALESGQVELPETSSTMKINGVYRQVTPIGFMGSAEEGTCTVEPIVSAAQEQEAILMRMEKNRNLRGGSVNSKRERQKARRARKRNK